MKVQQYIFSIDDFKYRNTKNAIYVYFNQEEIVNLEKKIKNGYVQIYGTFNNQLKGQFNMFSGGLHSIKYISILSIEDIDRKTFKPIESIRIVEPKSAHAE